MDEEFSSWVFLMKTDILLLSLSEVSCKGSLMMNAGKKFEKMSAKY